MKPHSGGGGARSIISQHLSNQLAGVGGPIARARDATRMEAGHGLASALWPMSSVAICRASDAFGAGAALEGKLLGEVMVAGATKGLTGEGSESRDCELEERNRPQKVRYLAFSASLS